MVNILLSKYHIRFDRVWVFPNPYVNKVQMLHLSPGGSDFEVATIRNRMPRGPHKKTPNQL